MIDPSPEDIAAEVRKVREAMRTALEACDIHITVNGEVTPLRECDWVLLAPCGCAQGVMSAVTLDTVYSDAGSAWHEMYDMVAPHRHKRVRLQRIRHMQREGYTVVPMLRHDAVNAHKSVCSHPKGRPVENAGSVDDYREPNTE